MVKLIDYNVGKLLKFLDAKNLTNNTIVVFSSDHGDLLLEHGKFDKGVPYKTSAGVPMIFRWPGKINRKVIKTAYSSVDFAPTLLNLLGINTDSMGFPGLDFSGDLINDNVGDDDEQLRFIDDSGGRWAAAVNKRYKLVLSKSYSPP